MDCVETNTGRLLQRVVVRGKEVKSVKFRFSSEHILYGKLRPYLNKVYAPDGEGICTTEFIPLLPNRGIYREFLATYLRTQYVVNYAIKNLTGARQPRVDLNAFFKLPVPIPFKNNKPDLEEQKRIVAKIEELFSKIDRIRELRRQAKEEAENLLKAALHHVFSRADEKGWKWVRLGEILYDKPQYGLTAKSTKEIKSYRYLRISDIDENGDLKNDDPRYLELEEDVAQKYLLHENDVLIARSGSVGRVYIHRIDDKTNQKVVFASYLIRFPIDKEKIEPKFFFYYGLSPFYWKRLKIH